MVKVRDLTDGELSALRGGRARIEPTNPPVLPVPYFTAGVCRSCGAAVAWMSGIWHNAEPIRRNGQSRGRRHICGTIG